jgi:hypothetical protein
MYAGTDTGCQAVPEPECSDGNAEDELISIVVMGRGSSGAFCAHAADTKKTSRTITVRTNHSWVITNRDPLRPSAPRTELIWTDPAPGIDVKSEPLPFNNNP